MAQLIRDGGSIK